MDVYMFKTKLDITWITFETCNADKRTAFENMCRMLFNQRFFEGKKLLHSNPNNPGVEVLPVIEPIDGKKISFQAKYFDTIDYTQILHSCEKVVSHYLGKIDIIYLYCNKDVTTTSKSYIAIVEYLKKNNIELVPITNQTILEEVMKNELVAWNFFNQVPLSQETLSKKLDVSLSTLGPRYNHNFNVYTSTESYLNLFLCRQSSIEEINMEKNQCIEKIKSSNWRFIDYKKYSKIIWGKIKDIPDVAIHTIEQCLDWQTQILELCNKEFSEIKDLIEKKNELLYKEDDREKIGDIREEIASLTYLLELPNNISPDEYSKNLIKNQILIVNGEAGVGKSQLFANAAKTLVDNGESVILLLGASYTSEEQVNIQSTNILDLGLSFDELLCKFEALATKDNTFAYIFIDAINESVYKNIWLSGLPTILKQISHFPHIKLAISVRDGYEDLVLNDSIKLQLENRQISRLCHRGFVEESVNATKTFLNFYGIPFLPSYYLQREMRNPLFLKLFCETYSGENYDLFSLFDRLVKKSEQEAMNNCSIKDSVSIIEKLLQEIADKFITTNSRIISQTDLFSLNFWDIYGLNNKKLPFIASLCKSGLLLSYASGQNEHYQLGYNLLDDFICAKAIVNQYNTEQELEKYLCDTILEIDGGRIQKYSHLDTSVIVLSLWSEKHGKELVEVVAQNITDENDLDDFSERYLMSFIWRKATNVNKDAFLSFIRTFPVETEDVFRVLIENASKEQHPLNALFLHNILFEKELAVRDAIWTTCINDMSNDDERLFQLVLHFDEGNTLDGLSKINTELLLTLFIWLFTSSNRFLRDKASKAAIELLKTNFDLCLPLLKRFSGVNDPYVLQRLYGVIFGACTKCQDIKYELYEELSKYIYENIFLQEKVYPDILLRDYAKLILENFIFVYPEKSGFIIKDNITPPYKSEPIPLVEKQEYYFKDAVNHGFNNIDFSMKMNIAETPGMYGDFGRYVFQSALSNFQSVDLANAFHYSMQFIRDSLGYRDELLGEYDSRQRYSYFSRSGTKKIERIGKKYQWIAMYNILARISDHHLLKEWDEEPHVFQGSWEPYVRDFDPTLNRNRMKISGAPIIKFPDYNFDFLPKEPIPDEDAIQEWTIATAPFFSSIPEYLCMEDEKGVKWYALYFNKGIKNKEFNYNDSSIGIGNGSQEIWLIADAFFVKNSDLELLNKHFSSSKFDIQNLPSASEVYQLYNREYAWSSGYSNLFNDSWLEYEIESGEYRIEKHTYEIPDFEHAVYDNDGNATIPMVTKEFERKIPIDSKFVKIAPAYSYLLWEEEYDASQENATYFNVPCNDLIKFMNLKQKEADGYFYSPNNDLVCFDYRLVNGENCFLCRADYLTEFLEKKQFCLCWKCVGEKQYFLGSHNQIWSRWAGLLYKEKNEILGDINITQEQQ